MFEKKKNIVQEQKRLLLDVLLGKLIRDRNEPWQSRDSDGVTEKSPICHIDIDWPADSWRMHDKLFIEKK